MKRWFELDLDRVVAFGVAMLLPAIAMASPEAGGHGHGEEHGGGGIVWVTWPPWGEHDKTGVLWLVLNFAVLLYILEKLLFSKLRARTAEKHDLIKAELDKATKARNEAESIIREYRDRMDRLDGEVNELMADAKKRADADRRDIIEAAEAEAERIKASATAAAEREAAARRRQIEKEVIDRALERAESLIRSKIGPTDQRRMVDDYIGDLDDVDFGSGGGR
jgi:F-type H+-transporting ATPase subunit b